MYHSERRRVIVASVVTVVAIPALWIMNGDSDKASSDPGVSAAPTPPPTSEYQPQTPVFVGGADQAPEQGGVINIAIADAPPTNLFKGRASFRRYPDTLENPCTAPLAPDTAVLTVINIDNGQSTTCTNIRTFNPPTGVDIVLHTDVFTKIGDIADSPIDVRVTW